MKIVQINATCGIGSTGKICVGISELLNNINIENYILYSNKTNGYRLGLACSNGKYIKLQAIKSKLFGNYGFNSKEATKKMISYLEQIEPDIVHLHNIHGHDCNLEQLFEYFKSKKTKLIWTFHDCWAFTAYCPYFELAKCDKWKTKCENCLQHKNFSWLFDRSEKLFLKKKELFSNLDLTIITPSQWLADITKHSFLGEYPIKVINNGIDISTFKPTKSEFRQKYSVSPNKKIVLGVAFDWGMRKGLDVFIELSDILDKNKYQIILVGTDDMIDKQLPKNIISIHRTHDQEELAEIYSSADVFVNPTREDNFPTVNIEALACGTPVITFRTGGSPEMLDGSCGSVVACDDINSLQREIIRICEMRPYSSKDCVNRALKFDKDLKFGEYIDLYREILND